jgi:hypothetical protein
MLWLRRLSGGKQKLPPVIRLPWIENTIETVWP